MRGNLFVISGSSGVGKGTIINRFLKENPNIWFSVSSTTRKPRPGEADGINYYFMTEEEFDNSVKNNEFLEWAEFGGNKYGTGLKHVLERLDKGVDVILEIEVQGAAQVKSKIEEAVLIFVLPPSREELEKRLRGRGTESEESIRKRLDTVEFEAKESEKFDAKIINDTVENAVSKLKQIFEEVKRRDERSFGNN